MNGALLFFVYAFFSRFLNENYVGFVVALLAIGVLAGGMSHREVIRTKPAAATRET